MNDRLTKIRSVHTYGVRQIHVFARQCTSYKRNALPFHAFVSFALCPNAKNQLKSNCPIGENYHLGIFKKKFSLLTSYVYSKCQSRETISRLRDRFQNGCCLYRFNQNKPSGAQHTYVLNEFSTADCSCTTKYFWKNVLQKFVVYIFTLLLAPLWTTNFFRSFS